MGRPRVFSGVQPTGAIHLGNWLGAIRNWVELQKEHETFFCVVDLHAITIPHEPKKLAEETLSTAALYLACGISPKTSTIFIQSHISAHAELCWLLNCITPLNWMERMIQFKEKSLKQGENVSIGLLDYPVLMASDILLYDTDLVPVGEDQKQHLELARDIAQQKVNRNFGSDLNPILKVPKPLILKEGARIMSLVNGKNKMSKSDPNENSRISLLDPPELIKKKIKRAKTDSLMGLEFDNNDRPEASNLLTIYSLVAGLDKTKALQECREMGWGTFKPLLTDAAISAIEPIQQRYSELMKDKSEIKKVLTQGQIKAEGVANKTLEKVRKAMGFL